MNLALYNLSNAVSKENIIQNINQIYTNYEVREVWGYKQKQKLVEKVKLTKILT